MREPTSFATNAAPCPRSPRLADLTKARAKADGQAQDARIAVDDLTIEQKKVDADVESVKARRERDQQRMDQGLISNPKDLQRMQEEMVSLTRRISSLEDDEIEVMERLEEAQTGLDAFTHELADLDAQIAEVTAARDTRLAEIDQALSALDADRGPADRRAARRPARPLRAPAREQGGRRCGAAPGPALRRVQPRPRPRRARRHPPGPRGRRDPL